jgi:hypothetical protein
MASYDPSHTFPELINEILDRLLIAAGSGDTESLVSLQSYTALPVRLDDELSQVLASTFPGHSTHTRCNRMKDGTIELILSSFPRSQKFVLSKVFMAEMRQFEQRIGILKTATRHRRTCFCELIPDYKTAAGVLPVNELSRVVNRFFLSNIQVQVDAVLTIDRYLSDFDATQRQTLTETLDGLFRHQPRRRVLNYAGLYYEDAIDPAWRKTMCEAIESLHQLCN